MATSNENSATKKVYNLILLDESGSMLSIYEPALTGVNETLQTIRGTVSSHPNQQHFISLVTFSGCSVRHIYSAESAEWTSDLTRDQFTPMGNTPLFDALGSSLHKLEARVEDNSVVLVTVITDGYENASREYTAEAIKALVERLEKKGWVFTYIGANQDVVKAAQSMSIRNFLCFHADCEGTGKMFADEKDARLHFFDRIDTVSSNEELADDYFSSHD